MARRAWREDVCSGSSREVLERGALFFRSVDRAVIYGH